MTLLDKFHLLYWRHKTWSTVSAQKGETCLWRFWLLGRPGPRFGRIGWNTAPEIIRARSARLGRPRLRFITRLPDICNKVH